MKTRATAKRPLASTLSARGNAGWDATVRVMPARVGYSAWRSIAWILRSALRSRMLILNGAVGYEDKYADLCAAALIKLLRLRTLVFLTEVTWEPTSRALTARLPMLKRLVPHMSRFAIRMIDSPRVTYGVLSTAEVEAFPNVWKVSPERVRFTPFTHTLQHVPDEDCLGPGHGYVFAGGNSLRDYELLAAALGGTAVPVRVAANWTPSAPVGDNFDVQSRSHDEFIRLLQNCSVCVVPLQPSVRSAGQQTYLNAMLLGKIVIVTDAPGVRDHIEPGVTGVIVAPNAADLRAAVEHALSEGDNPLYEKMRRAAHDRVLELYTPVQYRRNLLRHAEELLTDAGQSQTR